MGPWHAPPEDEAVWPTPPPARARAAPARPATLTPATALALQRSAGNRAVSAMLARTPESEQALTALATPQVFPGPEMQIQSTLVQQLEQGVADHPEFDDDCLFLGAIELKSIPATQADEDDWIKAATLIDLPPLRKPGADDPPMGPDPEAQSLRQRDDAYDMVIQVGADPAIIRNTLRTMSTAGQLDYLRKAGFVGKGWKILVEVHYYRNRIQTSRRMHKDTLGQTLFVNLNYETPHEIAGPEYIVNPRPSAEHDQQIDRTLPRGFMQDLRATRQTLGAPTEIGMQPIPAFGAAAFVDEAIHHMTPYYGNRKLSGALVAEYLDETDKARFDDAKQAHAKAKQSRWHSFEHYLTVIPKQDAAKWRARVEMTTKSTKTYTRKQLRKRAKFTAQEAERLFEEKQDVRFQQASIPGAPLADAQAPGAPPLERRMSTLGQKGKVPPKPTGERRFFRTWVRAVPDRRT
ncbi:hypothetical protein OJ998_11285 [Solirubrobacter taibaiensis]|nr:hypothetical protein [Solirubrobacter taibaiensis]